MLNVVTGWGKQHKTFSDQVEITCSKRIRTYYACSCIVWYVCYSLRVVFLSRQPKVLPCARFVIDEPPTRYYPIHYSFHVLWITQSITSIPFSNTESITSIFLSRMTIHMNTEQVLRFTKKEFSLHRIQHN
jgi:hypothetical protein